MTNFRSLICGLSMLTMTGLATAQSSMNSPYTRYGYGQLSDLSFGNSKAMGGIAIGLRDGYQVNVTNPASYSAVDSLTFLFDAGMTLQNANFSENGTKTNAKNSSVDYLAVQFRLSKGLGFTLGFVPFSTVGYSFSQTSYLPDATDGTTQYTTYSYDGDGGIQQVMAGLGYQVFKGLSVGANFSYLYGDVTHTFTTTFSNTSATKSVKTEQISVSDYKLDFGAQYTLRFNKKNVLNLGVIFSPGHEMNADGYTTRATYAYSSTYSSYLVQTTSTDTISSGFSLPTTFGVGATYVYDNRLTVGLDYSSQKWADAKYLGVKGEYLTNRHKVSAGMEFTPNYFSHNYLKRVRYRLGAYYATPYAKVDGREGANEYSVSAGFGLPLFNSKSLLNLSGQWVKVSPKTKGLLSENYLKLNIGLTFNEQWFQKWKVR